MEYLVVISLILSVLSFSAAVWMKVSERKWKKAMLDCIHHECKSSCDIALKHSNETAKALNDRMDDVAVILRVANSGVEKNVKMIQEIQEKLFMP